MIEPMIAIVQMTAAEMYKRRCKVWKMCLHGQVGQQQSVISGGNIEEEIVQLV